MSTAYLVVAILLVGAQAIGEEVGFRESLLKRSTDLCGSWLGPVLQAFLWGLWYVPVILLSRDASSAGTIARGGEFVVICLIVGALLGCLRLLAARIAPSSAATLLLTLGSGLPFVLNGLDGGAGMAIYQPCGWLPMVLILVGIRFAGISLVLGDRWFQQRDAKDVSAPVSAATS